MVDQTLSPTLEAVICGVIANGDVKQVTTLEPYPNPSTVSLARSDDHTGNRALISHSTSGVILQPPLGVFPVLRVVLYRTGTITRHPPCGQMRK